MVSDVGLAARIEPDRGTNGSITDDRGELAVRVDGPMWSQKGALLREVAWLQIMPTGTQGVATGGGEAIVCLPPL